MDGKSHINRSLRGLREEGVQIRKQSAVLVRSRHVGAAGVLSLLNELPDVRIIADVAQGPKAVEAAARIHPDHILVATDRVVDEVVKLLRGLRAASERSTITVFSDDIDAERLMTIGRIPVDGYLTWGDVASETLDWCLILGSVGIRVGSAKAVNELVTALERRERHPVAGELATVELAVLEGLMSGQTASQVAARNNMGERTVRQVIARLKRQLDAPTLFVLGARAHSLRIGK